MYLVIIILFLFAAALFISMRAFPAVKEKLATAWAAFVALLIAMAAGVAAWWTDAPVDIPPM